MKKISMVRKIAIIVLTAIFAGCIDDTTSNTDCWEISVSKILYACHECGQPMKTLLDTAFVKCDITQARARKYITDWGGVPNQRVIVYNGDGSEIRIRATYKPAYL